MASGFLPSEAAEGKKPGAERGNDVHPAIHLWRGIGWLAGPVVARLLHARAARGKEDPARLAERWGMAGAVRPEGPLAWVHAASVGEGMAVLPLLHRLAEQRPDLQVLLTTGTVTSAQALIPLLPATARHQFVPVDLPRAVDRFLGHWRPDLGIWTESEFWPGLMARAQASGMPTVLIQGRVSDRSVRRWRRPGSPIASLVGGFRLCLAQSDGDAERLRRLGGRDVRHLGNLKWAAPPLAHDEAELARLQAALAGRPLWLAASIHPGEEPAVIATHRHLVGLHPGLVTLVVPRHPPRAPAFAAAFAEAGLEAGLRSAGALPGAAPVHIADTIGELGLWYRLAPLAFVGGSLVPHGGQNPMEAARLDCAILHGPHMENFSELAAGLAACGGAHQVADGTALPAAAEALLDGPAADAARRAARAYAAGGMQVLDAVLGALQPWLPRPR